MGLREVLNRNPAIGVVVAVVVVIVALAVVFRSSGGGPLQNQGWFYDLQSGALFKADRFANPPITAPSGGQTGVRAVVLGCGSCPEAPTQAAWLEKLSPEALVVQKRIDAIAADTSDNPPTLTDAEQKTYDNGHLMALPPTSGDEPRWIQAESAEGQKAKDQIIGSACSDGKPMVCVPGT